ncbi:BolA family protein [Legionella hackeliae]|uniref:BolA like protein n=1 Tax=Legionella hackeliae TaxID=449 RepID=A0A0A8UQM2_LEGHA|nr:BolA/IbaG family iron-sulfur metabolism protein [Legionella hackeliae]KTD09563.1 BolA like protein [Legionella hackeliae]CEK11120.1 conserved protein of unknown function [Legionella hackeliae]STX47872.1 BolA like protein [Legionella hackeliae]
MINNEVLKQHLAETGEVDFVQVEGDGYHYQLTVVSDAFLGKTKVSRQQWVYAKLKDYITSGSLHAISMKTFTKEEWEKNRG